MRPFTRIQGALSIAMLATALIARGALADPAPPAPKHVTVSGQLVGLASYISYGRVAPPRRPPAAPMMPPPRAPQPLGTPNPSATAGMPMSGGGMMQGGMGEMHGMRDEDEHEGHEMREMHEGMAPGMAAMHAECASMGLVTSSGTVYVVAPEQMHAHMMLCMSLGRTVKLEGPLYTRAGVSLIVPQTIETGL